MTAADRVLWVDATAGVAGDMLLAALIDLGADLAAVQAAVDAVIPGVVGLEVSTVTRAGMRARRLGVRLLRPDQPPRTWREIERLLLTADLDDGVRHRAMRAFAALAAAEARAHGVSAAEVHFHEVGAWDCVADVVGVCAALGHFATTDIVVSELALGSGSVASAHGVIPVPGPAVLELVHGWPVTSGGDGELSTPTGVALLTTLAARSGPIPAMTVERIGVGAGLRDRPDRANVVRLVHGTISAEHGGQPREEMALLETNVDDLDPRVWPSLIEDLLQAGAADAWLTPAVMKKGRPGHVLSVLASPGLAPAVRRLVLDRTPALGVRQSTVRREILDRVWAEVDIPGGRVRIKVALRDGMVVHATPEFEDVAAVSAASGAPVREVLEQSVAAAVAAGLNPGAKA